MLASLLLWSAMVVPTADPLAAGFANPPFSARPHTWWHWMNGNVTREGITADLEAMREVGIGGAQMFTVDQNIPAGPAGYAGPLWRELTTHAIREAGRLGIELCIHNCAGWSSSGGPWIKPSDAMQVLAWSETTVEGPRSFSEVLPKPKAPQVVSAVDYYRDIAVYAFPTPENPASKPGDFLARTGVTRGDGLEPVLGSQMGVSRSDIKVLSTNLSGDGRLEWEVPAGKWTILRMGHVPTGKDNHPAPPEGDGLEVDKLSKEALDQHWEGLMAKVIADAGPLAGKVLNNSLIDSYEVGSQNWTPKFREEFRKRRGYDCLPYMPAIAGINVSDKATTERFLWDFRRTIADLFAENYFGYFGQKCHQAGLKFSVEPYGNGGFDNIQAGSKADIPMGEFWIPGWSMESVKLAASVGHVYGKQIVGAESFTADEGSGRWLEEPFNMKAVGDRAFTNGLNRVIFHRYAMQPWVDVKPGMTMGPWGTHLDRTQTWWTEAKEWLRYLSRCQYL
ncbi:MAG TPA: glycosyl hydrolase, partial [Fimbriimonadaceae bacterium]|nr:glycosyl hydrolase [Fimbriimonadaceae bacterium]